MSFHTPIISFTGKSGSGKTTLIEKLIKALSSRDIKVAAIKRSHHKVELDLKGKDSHRFQEAGANPSMITGLNIYGYVQSFETPPTLAELAGTVDKKADIILVEGFKYEQLDSMFRFVVISPDLTDQELIDKADGLIVSDDQSMTDDRPFYQRDDVEGLVEWIIIRFLPDMA